jgi:Uma2 family endonuclease
MTAAEFARLPNEDGYRHELVRGRIVRSPGPGGMHGEVEAHLVWVLKQYLQRYPVGRLLSGGASYVLERGPDTVRGPDISFISEERVRGDRLPETWPDYAPDLVIEILSPSNRPRQMAERRADLFRAGCREIWILAPRRTTVTIHRADGTEIELRAADVVTSDLLPGFRSPVAALFR